MAKAIDLFCGAGGLALGLRDAGFDIVAAVDNDAEAAKTYRHNLGDHLLEQSLADLSVEELLEFATMEVGECDLLAGGPPCQGFSVQRRGNDLDVRNHLVLDFARFIEGLRPRVFVLENVRGLMSKRGRPYFDRLIGRAESIGYKIQVAKLNAAEFGVPQERVRVFLVGELVADGRDGCFAFPEPSYRPGGFRTVRLAIGDLPTPPQDGAPHRDYPLHYREGRLSETNRERFRHIPEGGARDDLPEHLQLPCHVNNPSHRHKDVYGRLSWDSPAVTLTARFDSFTRGRFGHPTEDRSITLREGARLQTFPDQYHFLGNREEVARQIGNAVPPLLGQILGRRILDCLESLSPTNGASASAARANELPVLFPANAIG